MVFVNTKVWVERVARALEKAHYRVGVLSGDVPQKKRQSLLAKFQRGELEILVATDVAARGLHIDGVSHVYNFDLPFDAADYVHRIGRTARLGAEGDAISFACELYAQGLPEIESYIEQKIPTAAVTSELLMAIPRSAPPKLEGSESIADIFNEVRANAPADKRGGPKSGRSGPARGERPRSDKPRSDKPRSDKPHAERPRREQAAPEQTPSDARPRKSRRPRRAPHTPAVAAPPAASSAASAKPSAMARLGSRIKSWFTPRN
jgi:ATP-dependent RNA helicase RhlB